MREQVGVAPVLAVDAATKGYVDGMPALFSTPPIGWIAVDSTCSTFGTTPALTSGKQTFHRLLLGPGTYDALYVSVSTAQSGGTVTLTGALYNDDGSDTWPDTSTGPIVSGAFPALTSTGMKLLTLSSPLVLTRPTLLWVSVLYVDTTAPSTAPLLASLAGNLNSYARSVANGFAGVRGYFRSGLSAPANTASTTANLSVSGSTDIVAVAIRRSA